MCILYFLLNQDKNIRHVGFGFSELSIRTQKGDPSCDGYCSDCTLQVEGSLSPPPFFFFNSLTFCSVYFQKAAQFRQRRRGTLHLVFFIVSCTELYPNASSPGSSTYDTKTFTATAAKPKKKPHYDLKPEMVYLLA